MKLVGLPILEDAKQKHPVLRGPLDSWRLEVEHGGWRGPSDVRRRFPSASFLTDNRIVFNIKGNSYRLAVQVSYSVGLVRVVWCGTHSEYDRQKF